MLIAAFHLQFIILADTNIVIQCQRLIVFVEEYTKLCLNCNQAIKGRDEKMSAAYCRVKYMNLIDGITHLS